MSTKIQNRVFAHTPLHGFSGLRISLKILLQKVEELTLYIIQQQKQIEVLQKELEKSKK